MTGVALFLGAREAQVAGQTYEIAPGISDGAVRLLDDGPELRPLSFGERSRLARAAAQAVTPEEELAQAVLAVATVAEGDHPAAAPIALHLAGAGGSDLGFSAAQSLLARHLGWSQADVSDAPATEVDALAADWRAGLQAGPTGWTRFVLAGPDAHEGDTPEAVALALARDLLVRAAAGIDTETIPAVTGHGPAPASRPGIEDQTSSPGLSAGQSGEQTAQSGLAQSRTDGVFASVLSAEANPTLQPGPVTASPGHTAEFVSANPTPHPAPVEHLPRARDGAPLPALGTTPQSRNSLAANPAPHPAPRQPGSGVAARTSTPRSEHPPMDQVQQSIRAELPPQEFGAPSRTLSDAVPIKDDPLVAPFAGWFDEAPRTQIRSDDGRTAVAEWVWDRSVAVEPMTPDLPGAQVLATLDDPVGELAEALHLAADLRGIAP